MADVPVFHEAQRVGSIEPGLGGASFGYDPGWLRNPRAFPISVRMPLGPGRVPPGIFERWAAGLLPEGPQRTRLAQQLGLAPEDTFGILARTGRDTPGALSIDRPRTEDSAGLLPVGDEGALAWLLEELPQRPLLGGQDGVSMTLGGARAKLPVALDTVGRIALPH